MNHCTKDHKPKMFEEQTKMLASVASVANDIVVKSFVNTMKFISSLPSPIKEAWSFVVFYFVLLPILFLPCIFILLIRFTISFIFQTVYKRSYKLMESADVVHTFDSPGSVDTINFFIYVNGNVHIEELRKRIKKSLSFKDKSGEYPYWRMCHSSTQKFGFRCWEDKGDGIDLKHHIRYCPGMSNPKKIYTEKELFQVTSEYACQMWDESKPKWEFLVTPQVRIPDKNNNVYSAILFRISHEYGDGISLMQFMRHAIFDSKPKLIFDPVNPPIPTAPLYLRCLLWIQLLILGPSDIIKFFSYRGTNKIFAKGPMKGPKFVGRTRMEIPLEMTRRIRKSLNCTTSAVIHTAFCGAIRKLAKEKKISVPKESIGGMAQAMLPYPNEHLQNHFTPLGTELHLQIDDTLERLRENNKRLKPITRPHSAKAVYYAYSSFGIFPTFLMKIGMGDIECLYAASNVPGIVGTVKFDGNPVEMVFGTPPSCIGMNFMIGLGCYDEKFIAGFMFNDTTLVESKEDLDKFIKEFEREIEIMDKNSMLQLQ